MAEKASPILSPLKQVWNAVFPELEKGSTERKGLELSAIIDHMNSDEGNRCRSQNHGVKVILISHFQERIEFSYPKNPRKSVMVFMISAQTSQSALAGLLRSSDPIEVATRLIRNSLNDFDFDIDDRFCNTQDLQLACTSMPMPDPLIKFFGCLYNFDPTTYPRSWMPSSVQLKQRKVEMKAAVRERRRKAENCVKIIAKMKEQQMKMQKVMSVRIMITPVMAKNVIRNPPIDADNYNQCSKPCITSIIIWEKMHPVVSDECRGCA